MLRRTLRVRPRNDTVMDKSGLLALLGADIKRIAREVMTDLQGDLRVSGDALVTGRMSARELAWDGRDLEPGWMRDDTVWIYDSGSTMLRYGEDVSDLFPAGAKLRWKQGGGWLYARVVSADFDEGVVTLTVSGDTVLDAEVDENWFSYDWVPPGWTAGDDGGGWVEAGETWVYETGTSITVSGDKTGKYSREMRVRFQQSATTKYFVIDADPTYDSGADETTIALLGRDGATVADEVISDPAFSYSYAPFAFPFPVTPVELLSSGGVFHGYNVTSTTLSATLDPGCDFLVVFWGARNVDSRIVSITADGVPMSLLNTSNWGKLFYLAAPPTGTFNIVATYSGYINNIAFIYAGLSHVKAADPFRDWGEGGGPFSISLTPLTEGDLVMNFIVVGDYSGTPSDPSAGAEEAVFENYWGTNGCRVKGAWMPASDETETVTWTWGHQQVAVALRPA